MPDSQKANDGFQSINKSLGTSKDPRVNTHFMRNNKITQIEANNIYVQNWIASNIVDVPADESIKKWRELNITDENKLTAFEDEEIRLDLKGCFGQARKWANVFGGAIIVMIIEGQELSEPLTTVKKGSLKRLLPMDRWEVTANELEFDLLNDNFGKPQSYTHSQSGQVIHNSRVFHFNGDSTTIKELRENNFWGLSIYEKLMPVIQDAMTSSDLIGGLLFESNIDVYKLKGLNDLVADGQDTLAQKRIKLAHELKSTINGIVLDSDDGYEKKYASFAGLAEIDDKFLQKVCGAARMPVTKLLGTSATGLNATGEGDLKNYYDEVASMQQREYTPHLRKLDTIISMSLFGTDIKVTYEFKPLFQLSEKEVADMQLVQATRDAVYITNGVVDDEMILKELNSNKTYGDISEHISD